ncbi:hypothetical protein PG2093B_1354 [Bifidobacterium pseudolongum subsp. globosum]|uniref:Uncharacterized protein n=1 Tax=Bifidobacterium pseudolongum subsp. globosum TaxID=1690 RepID=A0A4Q5A137_9BIFI|nr:hypothetical protein [Bifidobacterium pseudolongum]RYQ09070.1 hypothetical protein PG2093B_1354 [Bifidobacterium pseudolongum subsp. globosum]
MRNRGLGRAIGILAAIACIMPTASVAYAGTDQTTDQQTQHTIAAERTDTERPAATTTTHTQPSAKTSAKTSATQAPERITPDDAAQSAVQNGPDGALHDYLPSHQDVNDTLPDTTYNGVPLIGHWLSAKLAKRSSSAMDFDPSGDKPSRDGNAIEHIDVSWVTPGAKDGTLALDPQDNTALSVKMRVDYALSGQHDYDPGAVQITVPLNIFKDRAGEDEGALSLSIPEDPSQDATFSYRRVGDRVVITNVQRLPAATQGYMEMSIRHIMPAEVVSGSTSAPFGAKITVVTQQGDTLSRTSNTIDAVITTDEQVRSATKNGTVYETMPSEWPSSRLALPAGFKPQDYVYVDWYTYAYISATSISPSA